MQKLSIVILNFNGRKHLETFLPSVLEHAGGHEIVIADNASTDESVDFLKSNYPEIRLIINKSNGGFAQGYNEALKQVESEFYLLLNSDIEVTANWTEPLLEAMKDNRVAGCQPKVLSYSRKTHFEHAGAAGGYLDKNYFPFCRGRIFEHVEEDLGQYNEPKEVFWATGAALMIRSKCYHEAGGLDEDFFAHMEEIDLCWRLKQKGYKFMAIPESKIHHVGGGTLDYASPFKTYLNFRNSLFMLIKNHPGLLFPKLIHRMLLDGVAGTRFLMRGEFKQLQSVLKAHRDMYKSLGKQLKKRKYLKAVRGPINNAGLYPKSILVQRFLGGKTKYSELF